MNNLRVMVIGAHPDDADLNAGCTAAKLAAAGARVQFVSMCNGNKGHQAMTSVELAARRYGETQASAKVLGIERYIVLNHPDCELEANLETRRELTRIVRRFAPHIILTHRTCDYHADHRAVGQLVMDMTYLLGVPLWCEDVPIPEVAPAVLYMRDDFTVPRELRCDIAVKVTDEFYERNLRALACHTSQFFEWLPFDMKLKIDDGMLQTETARMNFIREHWTDVRKMRDAKRFNLPYERAEVFEVSEYGRVLSQEERAAFEN